MVVHNVWVGHAPLISKHPDTHYDGFKVVCTCGWIPWAYDPPDTPLFFNTPDKAEAYWDLNHGQAPRLP